MTLGGRIEVEPRALVDGLKIGAHMLRTAVNDDSTALNRTRLQVYGPYVAYMADQWEVLSEYYRFSNRDLSGNTGTHNSSAWYTQGGYLIDRYTPYVRYERASLDQTDHYFAQQINGRSYSRGSLGLRYDLSSTAALAPANSASLSSSASPAKVSMSPS